MGNPSTDLRVQAKHSPLCVSRGLLMSSILNIPVELVYWTALENRGEEDGKPIYGPKGPGQALTPMCIPWFTDVLHLEHPRRARVLDSPREPGRRGWETHLRT